MDMRSAQGGLIEVTRGEFRELTRIRLQVLDELAKGAGTIEPVPVRHRWGYSAAIKVIRRDRDGSLLAVVTGEAPHLKRPYRRKIRLVKRNPTP
jgi:hypothetical protein